jgi:hypothetical protein
MHGRDSQAICTTTLDIFAGAPSSPPWENDPRLPAVPVGLIALKARYQVVEADAALVSNRPSNSIMASV